MEHHGQLQYDEIHRFDLDSEELEYGCIRGNQIAFVIITGRGGSIFGYENKYLHLAHIMHQKYGCSVICFKCPSASCKDSIQSIFDTVDSVMSDWGYTEYQIYLYAASAGGLLAVQGGTENPAIRRMLVVNCPLAINWGRTKEGILNFQGESLTMAYAEKDPSISLSRFLYLLENKRVHLHLIPDEDHYLSNHPDTLRKLVETFLF